MKEAVEKAFKNYAVFEGRSNRSDYWYFFLFNFLVSMVLSFVDNSGNLVNLFYLVGFVPGAAIGVRRMHDVNKSGWFLLIPIYNFILTLTDSVNEGNKYGELVN